MEDLTFLANVAGGQLQHGTSLAAFEGRQVRVTVALPPSPVCDEPAQTDEEGPPEGMDVENDILLEMPRTLEVVRTRLSSIRESCHPRLSFPRISPMSDEYPWYGVVRGD